MVEERSAFKSAMQSLSSQFMAFAEPEILKTSVRNIVLGSVLAAASVAAMAQGGNDPAVLSKNSASRWSEMLGGAMAGEATKGVFGKGVAGRVFTGVASEMGRNSAKILIGGAYGDSQQQQEQGSGRGVGGSPLTAQQSDHLDTLALRSVFAYEKYKQNEPQGMVSSSRLRAMSAPFVNQRKQFDMAYRAARSAGQDVSGWTPMAAALSAQVGSVSLAHMGELADPMMARLQREGGPGFQEVQQAENLNDLRQKMNQRQPSNGQVAAAPGM